MGPGWLDTDANVLLVQAVFNYSLLFVLFSSDEVEAISLDSLSSIDCCLIYYAVKSLIEPSITVTDSGFPSVLHLCFN